MHEAQGIENEAEQTKGTEAPKIQKLTQQEKQQRQDHEEDAKMDANIDQIGRDRDLSPRKIGQLKRRNRKENKSTVAKSQINTKSKTDCNSSSDQ